MLNHVVYLTVTQCQYISVKKRKKSLYPTSKSSEFFNHGICFLGKQWASCYWRCSSLSKEHFCWAWTDRQPPPGFGEKEDTESIYPLLPVVVDLVVQSLSCVWLSVTPWTVALRAPLLWDCAARILEWAAISFSRGSSWPRDQIYVSWIGRQLLYYYATREIHLVCSLG